MKRVRIVIIGGVAAGASAAGKAARTNPDAHITMLEKGPYISYANCGLPYYISGEIPDRGKLIIRRPEDMRKKYGIETYVNTEVIKIERPAKKVMVRDLTDNSTREIEYDKLIIATGAKTFRPPIPGLDAKNVFTLRTIPDIDAIEKYIRDAYPRRAAVLGAGYIGIEVVDVLRKRGIETGLFEMLTQALPQMDPDMSKYIEDKMEKAGINLFLGDAVEKLETDTAGNAVRVVTKNGKSMDVDMVIASLGVKPDVKLAKEAGLEIGEYALITDDYMRTSDPDIYAAGDVIQVNHLVTGKPTWSPLAGPANLQGKVAGCNAAGGIMKYRGVLRTSIVQFNGLAIATTGLTEKEAVKEELDYYPVTIESTSNSNYITGAKPLHIKAIFMRNTQRLLGAQVVGESGADKRIDIFATALMAKMNARDLEHLDLAYSPQYSHSLDGINVVGTVAGDRG
ncbi:MAG: FAD-dependent oxidoreductase [Candidatus Eremiobacteraeota bacterium]|nr:FAD-dependent oxidoreductase [Candidatus Eremiobacteraeota bacterium]